MMTALSLAASPASNRTLGVMIEVKLKPGKKKGGGTP